MQLARQSRNDSLQQSSSREGMRNVTEHKRAGISADSGGGPDHNAFAVTTDIVGVNFQILSGGFQCDGAAAELVQWRNTPGVGIVLGTVRSATPQAAISAGLDAVQHDASSVGCAYLVVQVDLLREPVHAARWEGTILVRGFSSIPPAD